jgi:hypothetical protein
MCKVSQTAAFGLFKNFREPDFRKIGFEPDLLSRLTTSDPAGLLPSS